MTLATVADVERYVRAPRHDIVDSLPLAEDWVAGRIELNGAVPPYVREATALLGAIVVDEGFPARVPTMIQVMLIPALRVS